MLSNVYGWFLKVEHGVYALTETGRQALLRWPQPLIADENPASSDL